MNDYELNRRELTGDQALRFAREAGMEEASRQSLFYAGVGDLIRFARLVREGWTPPRPSGVTVGTIGHVAPPGFGPATDARGVTGTQAPSDAPCKAHHLIACVQCTSGVIGGDDAQA